jgi:hypothetical protein
MLYIQSFFAEFKESRAVCVPVFFGSFHAQILGKSAGCIVLLTCGLFTMGTCSESSGVRIRGAKSFFSKRVKILFARIFGKKRN